MISMPILCIVALFTVVWLRHAVARSRKISLPSWGQLARELQPVPKEAIRTLAEEYLHPTNMSSRTNEEVWDMLGGAEGLDRMTENAKILIALASYAQRWNNEEGAAIAERMRHDAQVLRRAVFNISVAGWSGYGRKRLLAYATEAAVSYQFMRERLLMLYKNNHSGIYPVLVDSI